MRIALIGTRGVPARYGGFETCVEEVGSRLAIAGHEVTVYCRPESASTGSPLRGYRGMRRVELPALRRRSLETLSHTALSTGHLSVHRCDVAVVFNAANSPFLPVLRARRIPVATHVDGLEWKRDKWGPTGKRYYRAAEALSVRWSDALIADAQGIADYYAQEFGAPTELISYGAPVTAGIGYDRLSELDLVPGEYHLVVARFEPENHVADIVEGYVASSAKRPLVVVGAAPYGADYTARIERAGDHRVRMLGGVWDQRQLDQLYANAFTYLHGHSVGGTNPSLLRAIGAAASTIAYDVGFNREVLGSAGRYFTDAGSVATEVEAAEADPVETRDRGHSALDRASLYNWDDVAARYEALCQRLAAGDFARKRPSGRRSERPRQAGAARDWANT
jgi:glycosyltransferase involved in cell wall biosynthesis